MKIGIIGLGFVGGAICKSFQEKGIDCIVYDKYKKEGNLESCLHATFLFLCLPTLFNNETSEYDKSAIHETCQYLQEYKYKGKIILKSTIEPETTENLKNKYSELFFVHNPEFLTAKTAYEDFHHQSHIVLGITSDKQESDLQDLIEFYQKYYPNAEISTCSSTESESMKIFCNSFYAAKVQFFTELYLLCQKNNTNYTVIKNLMLKNGWINPMHTTVPGPDGNISYGGYCFPKDTSALLAYMQRLTLSEDETFHKVLEAVVQERNQMRQD